MFRKKFFLILISIALVNIFIFAGCAGKKRVAVAPESAASLVEKAHLAANECMTEKNRGKAIDAAEKGIKLGENCVKYFPDEAGCHYWHAVNVGLYYKLKIIGYQRGVKKMIEDAEKVASIDPTYDHAGAYRMMGELYTMLPQTGGNVDSVTRDLTLAEKYLTEATEIAPEYPENYIALAEALFELEKYDDAKNSLFRAKSVILNWKDDVSYKDWSETITKLDKKLNKKLKKKHAR